MALQWKTIPYSDEVAEAIHTHAGADITSPVANATDADMVDGQHASAFAPASHIHNYVHTQMVASDTWTINHDMNKKPSVTVIDSAGTYVMGDMEYPSNSQVVLRFSHPFAGTATLN